MSEKRANLEVANGVVRRIQRFLAGLEHARRQPNRREAYHICVAMEHLQAGRLDESEDALRKADRLDPVPPDIATQSAYNETPTVKQLQIALDRLRPN
jgi:cytochrome c-type biogenesis protein CcmH/NrfG